MNITVIGTGYVGLVTGACFSKMGNKVYCVDIDEDKIKGLKNGILPIFEPHLGTMVKNSQEKGDLIFTTEIKEALDETDIIFIAVGTQYKVFILFIAIYSTNDLGKEKSFLGIITIVAPAYKVT